MYKSFILAASIAIFPLTKDIAVPVKGDANNSNSLFTFRSKNALPSIFTNSPGKIKEPWSQNWMATAQEHVRKAEYHFSREEKLNAWCTPNRKSNLRFFYTDKGFTVEPRTAKIPIN